MFHGPVKVKISPLFGPREQGYSPASTFKGGITPMPTIDRFSDLDDPLPLFLGDEPDQQGGKLRTAAVFSSRLLNGSILVATLTAIGIAILWVGQPVMLFAEVTPVVVEKPAIQPDIDQLPPTIRSTAHAEAFPPVAKDELTGDEISTTAESAGQTQTETSEHEALFREFQAWSAQRDAQVQAGAVSSVQDAPAQVGKKAEAPLPPMKKQLRPVQSAGADIRPVQNSQKKIRRDHNARALVTPAQDSRAQDQSVQNEQPSFLQIFGWRN
jgi:hypothetical protein